MSADNFDCYMMLFFGVNGVDNVGVVKGAHEVCDKCRHKMFGIVFVGSWC